MTCAAVLLILLVSFTAGCGGGNNSSSSNTIGPPAKVVFSTVAISLDLGQVFTGLGVSVFDANNNLICVTGGTAACDVTYSVTVPGYIDVANNGWVCAGTWDSKTAPVVCKVQADDPNTAGREGVGTVSIVATYNNVKSESAAVVAVHVRIASITISSSTSGCTSSASSQQFTATAFDANGVDVTTSAGAFSWGISDGAIGTIDFSGKVLALKPGSATVLASNNGVASLPATFQTCPPASITLVATGTSNTSAALNVNETANLSIFVADTKGVTIDPTNISLSFLNSAPRIGNLVATSTGGTFTGTVPGSSVLVASCSPPTCNQGVGQPIYSNAFTLKVNGTSATTVYATGTTATSVVPIDTSTNTAGTAITIPTITPSGGTATQPTLNSILMSRNGDRVFLGTNLGMLILSTASNTFGTPVLPGTPVQVIAISPDGSKVIARDATSAQSTNVFAIDVSQITTSVTTLSPLQGVSTAAWTPDSLKAFIPVGGSIFVYSQALGNKTIQNVSAGPAIATLPQGGLMFKARTGPAGVDIYSVCDNTQRGSITTIPTPAVMQAALNGSRVIAADGSTIAKIDVSLPGQACPPVIPALPTAQAVFGGPVQPTQLIVLPDGSKAYLTSVGGPVVAYNANANTVATIATTGGGTATTGGVTADGASVYVGATGTNDVQLIDTATNTVTKQIAVNLKKADGTTVATPDLVVVKP